jgi:Arrestin (or S-antigen), N-terminal domain/SpoOM protein
LIDLFGGATEKLSIYLEKLQYHIGETVRGKLLVSTNKDSKARAFRFVAEGKEETRIVVRYTDHHGSDNYYTRSTERKQTYTDSDTFFKQDLFEFVSGNEPFAKESGDGITTIKGKHEIPFEFVIPSNALESYNGKNAWVRYTVKATIDKKLRGDLNESISFAVMGTGNRSGNVPPNPIVISDQNSKGLAITLEVEESTYNAGDNLHGMVTLQSDNDASNIRSIQILLTATEYATASGQTKTNIIDERAHNIAQWEYNKSLPFEIRIPQTAPKSYVGRYSELYWTIKAKVDMPMGFDLNASSRIEIF